MRDSHDILLAPIQSEKSFAGISNNRYSFKVAAGADKVQIRKAVEQVFDVTVTSVNTSTVKPKPKRRGHHQGIRPGYRKAVVELKPGDSIQIFEGVH